MSLLHHGHAQAPTDGRQPHGLDDPQPLRHLLRLRQDYWQSKPLFGGARHFQCSISAQQHRCTRQAARAEVLDVTLVA